jgi:hypothetical protein
MSAAVCDAVVTKRGDDVTRRPTMYRQQLVWNGFGWEYATVFVPFTTGVYPINTGFYNGVFPYAGITYPIPGQVVSVSYATTGGRFR